MPPVPPKALPYCLCAPYEVVASTASSPLATSAASGFVCACVAAACWATWVTSTEVGVAFPLDICQGFAGGAPDMVVRARFLLLLPSPNEPCSATDVSQDQARSRGRNPRPLER
uniref:Uncharacterized protein n=1 Tax=Chloropicon roscoffensis TaxID=1461544 RepID=A0A7S3CAC1_9CHLO